MIKIKPLFLILILVFLFTSCTRQRHKVTFQSPFPAKKDGIWGFPLPEPPFIINSAFGELRKKGTSFYRHQGIDIKAKEGTPVLAVQKGTVIFAGPLKDYGLLVCIEHPGNWETRYAHLSSIAIKTNKKVKKGQIIGRVGATGNATGPHLHFELRKNGTPINPAPLITQTK